MSQVSDKLRRCKAGYTHWCPGCEEMHILPDRWQFDGNLVSPTFTPSFKHTWGDQCCHYILTDGILHYCGDCTHSLAGQAISLPDLPLELTD